MLPRDADSHAPVLRAGEALVGAGEGVDAVVVGGVGEGAEFVEEVVAVRATDDFDQSILSCRGDGTGADVFGTGGPVGADGVAA